MAQENQYGSLTRMYSVLNTSTYLRARSAVAVLAGSQGFLYIAGYFLLFTAIVHTRYLPFSAIPLRSGRAAFVQLSQLHCRISGKSCPSLSEPLG